MATNNAVNTTLSGQTGTGTFVGHTSPTLVTPILGVAAATSINFGGNALSVYAEGTFTPSFTGSGGGSATYGLQTGSYTRIGNRYFFNISMSISASTLSGAITITGMPFTINTQTAVTVWGTGLGATATTALTCLAVSGGTTLSLWVYSAGTATQLTGAQLGSSMQMWLNGNHI